MEWIIYKHTNKVNGKVYIGQTKQTPDRRWRNGVGYTRDNCDTHFARAINKYGWDNFYHEILEDNILTQEEANKREIFWIGFYDSMNNGYNGNSGGDVKLWSEESKKKASLSHKGLKFTESHLQNLRVAIKESAQKPERNKKISEALSGREFSEEHKQKISGSAKQRIGEKNAFYGHHHSEEVKEKYKLMFGKPVICLETNVKFNSANEAGKILGIDGANIRSSCRFGIQAKVGKKWFHFYYENEPKPTFLYNKIKKVLNVETNEIFENLIDAAKSIGKSSKLVGQCCNGKCKTAGGYHWQYIE